MVVGREGAVMQRMLLWRVREFVGSDRRYTGAPQMMKPPSDQIEELVRGQALGLGRGLRCSAHVEAAVAHGPARSARPAGAFGNAHPGLVHDPFFRGVRVSHAHPGLAHDPLFRVIMVVGYIHGKILLAEASS